MKKTSVYLSHEDVIRLQRLSAKEGRPQAHVIRDALGVYEANRKPDRNFKIAAAYHSPGTPFSRLTAEEVDNLMGGFGSDSHR